MKQQWPPGNVEDVYNYKNTENKKPRSGQKFYFIPQYRQLFTTQYDKTSQQTCIFRNTVVKAADLNL